MLNLIKNLMNKSSFKDRNINMYKKKKKYTTANNKLTVNCSTSVTLAGIAFLAIFFF